jgi:hypothetical protein
VDDQESHQRKSDYDKIVVGFFLENFKQVKTKEYRTQAYSFLFEGYLVPPQA